MAVGIAPSFTLVTTPRSGSTPVGRWLGAYAEKYFDTIYVDELFSVQNPADPRLKLKSPLIKSAKWMRDEKLRRLKLLVQKKGQVSFKLFAGQLNQKQTAIAVKNQQLFVLKRRDVFEHFLSWCIANLTGHWYSETGLKQQKQSLVLDAETAKAFFDSLLCLKKFETTHKIQHTFYFEDFLSDGLVATLKPLGWTEKIPTVKASRILGKQTKGDKLLYFSKPTEVKKIFAELQQSYAGDLK